MGVKRFIGGAVKAAATTLDRAAEGLAENDNNLYRRVAKEALRQSAAGADDIDVLDYDWVGFLADKS